MSEIPLEISLPDQSDEHDGNERPTVDDASSRLYEKISPVIQLFSDFAETKDNSATFLERLLDQVKTVMGADLLLLFGWDEGKQEWPLLYHHRLPTRIIKDGVVPRAWQSLPSIVLQEGDHLFSDNIAKDRRFVGQVIRGLNLHTFSAHTLRSKDILLGSVSICYENPDALSPVDQEAFALMAKLLIPLFPLKEKQAQENKAQEIRVQDTPIEEKPESMVLSLDLSGRILSCDASFADLLGHPPERILKKPLSRFLTRASRGKYSEALKALKADQGEAERPPLKLEVAKHGGRKRILQASLQVIKSDDQLVGFEMTAENVSDIEPLEKELLIKDVVLSILNSLFISLGQSIPEEESLKTAFDKVVPFFGAEAGMLLQLDDKRQKLQLLASQGLQTEGLDQPGKKGIDRKEHVLWKVIEEKTPILLVAESKDVPLDTQQVGEADLVSYMAVPLESSDQLWGVLCFFSATRIFTAADLKSLETIGQQIGFAVNQTRLYHCLHKQIDALKVLNEAGKSLSKSLNLEQALASTVNSLRKMIGVSNSYIFMTDDKRNYLTGVAASGQLGNAVRKMEFKSSENSLVPLTARERHPIIVENASREAIIGKKWMKTFKSRSLLSVPLINKERVLGVMILDECRFYRKFRDEEVEKIVGLAEQVTLSIENAKQYHAVSRHRERLQTLSSAIVNIQEEEHRRIAKKLRSEAGGALTTIQKDLAWINETLEGAREPNAASDPALIKKRLEKMKTQIGETAETLRALSHGLRPAILDDSGLISTLKWYIKEFESQNKTKVLLQTNGSTKRFPARIEILLFRIVQEAMANISDHSAADSAIVSLEKREPYAHLYITDDGKGFDVKKYFSSPQVIRKGIGILGMKERIELAGGTFFIDSNPGNGTRISIRVPVVRRSAS